MEEILEIKEPPCRYTTGVVWDLDTLKVEVTLANLVAQNSLEVELAGVARE